MSAGISNLGMGYEPQRYNSTTVLGSGDYAAQAAAQQAAIQAQAPQSPQSYMEALARQSAQQYSDMLNNSPEMATYYSTHAKSTADDFYKNTLFNLQQETRADGSGVAGNILGDNVLGSNFGKQFQGYLGSFDGAGVMAGASPTFGGQYAQQQAAINKQAAEAAAKAKAEADARANNQAVQQQAYNQQTGGGFNGGILNSSYAQPFGNTITGTANTPGFNGGMMGAPSTAAASTGLSPTGPAAGMLGTGFGSVAAPQAGANAWGGPFSNKNPWSLG